MTQSLRIIFAGTPDFGIPSLEGIYKSQHEVIATFTQPDRPFGRGKKLQASAIKTWANAHDIHVYQPINFKEQANIDELIALKPDLMVVIAYGLILPEKVLNIPRFGCINVHASILPRWRGASPIQHAILYGDTETGITIMQMDKGMDTGAIYEIVTCPIETNDTTITLQERLAKLAVTPLLNTIEKLQTNNAKKTIQNAELATYAPKINKADAKIDWQQSANEIERKIRAFNPWPLANTNSSDTSFQILQAKVSNTNHSEVPGTILSISKQGLLVNTKKNALLIEKIKFPGKKVISITDYLNSQQTILQVGMLLE